MTGIGCVCTRRNFSVPSSEVGRRQYGNAPIDSPEALRSESLHHGCYFDCSCVGPMSRLLTHGVSNVHSPRSHVHHTGP